MNVNPSMIVLLGLQLKKFVTSMGVRKGCWARVSSWQHTIDDEFTHTHTSEVLQHYRTKKANV